MARKKSSGTRVRVSGYTVRTHTRKKGKSPARDRNGRFKKAGSARKHTSAQRTKKRGSKQISLL